MFYLDNHDSYVNNHGKRSEFYLCFWKKAEWLQHAAETSVASGDHINPLETSTIWG